MNEEEILKRLDRIERILLKSPEVHAAVFITMWEEWENARFQGRSAKDLWEIILPTFEGQESPREEPAAPEELIQSILTENLRGSGHPQEPPTADDKLQE